MKAKSNTCFDCGVSPGQLHRPGCDIEKCPRCGGQAISCGCINEVCGEDDDYSKWDAEWGGRRMPWTGEWPGNAECHEYGFWCRWDGSRGWVTCSKDTPGAREDLNRLVTEGRWNVERQRFEMPGR